MFKPRHATCDKYLCANMSHQWSIDVYHIKYHEYLRLIQLILISFITKPVCLIIRCQDP